MNGGVHGGGVQSRGYSVMGAHTGGPLPEGKFMEAALAAPKGPVLKYLQALRKRTSP